MDEFLAMLPGGSASLGGLLTAMAMAVVYYLPKLNNNRKVDGIDGTLLDRVIAHENRLNAVDAELRKNKIHVTELMIFILRLEALLTKRGVQIPPEMQSESARLKAGP